MYMLLWDQTLWIHGFVLIVFYVLEYLHKMTKQFDEMGYGNGCQNIKQMLKKSVCLVKDVRHANSLKLSFRMDKLRKEVASGRKSFVEVTKKFRTLDLFDHLQPFNDQ